MACAHRSDALTAAWPFQWCGLIYEIIPMPLALSDSQLNTVMMATADLPPEKRSLYLERVGAMMNERGRFNDTDVAKVAKLALTGLVRQPA